MKMIWIYLSLAIVTILVISGVGVYLLFKGDEEPEIEKDGKETTILKRDTLKIVDTIYGEVNVSYLYYKESQVDVSEYYYNITVDIEYPSEQIDHLMIDWKSIRMTGGVGGVGGGSMQKLNDNSYYTRLPVFSHIWDVWIEFYEQGAKVWDGLNQTSYYRSFRTEIIGFTISDEHYASEMENNIIISDIRYGFEKDSMNRFNITFHVSSTSNPRSILLRYDMDLISEDNATDREIGYGSNNTTNYATFDISDDERDDIRFLYFSIGVSDMDQMRVTSPVIRVPFM